MGEIKIFDSELLVMEYLWENGPCLAADLAEEFLKRYNWKKSTTYIVLKRLEEIKAEVEEELQLNSEELDSLAKEGERQEAEASGEGEPQDD